MANTPRQPRNFKDRALVWISGRMAGGRVPLVENPPRLVRAVDRQMGVMAPAEEETDSTFLADDDSIWSFEFQFRDSEADEARMAAYYATLLRLHHSGAGRSLRGRAGGDAVARGATAEGAATGSIKRKGPACEQAGPFRQQGRAINGTFPA